MSRAQTRPSFSPNSISRVLSQNQVRVVYQPIVDIATRKVFAHEALARSDAGLFKSPPEMFDAAVEQKKCGELGRRIRTLAVEGCPDVPLFLNVHPAEFAEHWLVQPDDPIFSHDHRVFLEITESVPLSHFKLVSHVLREIRGKGIHLVVDDLGAGYSNLKYIADLAPEFVKLDRELIAGLGGDARLRKLVSSIVRLCTELGAQVVAEGIETADEALASQDAGVGFGQGYFFARPASPPPPVDVAGLAQVLGVRRRVSNPGFRRRRSRAS